MTYFSPEFKAEFLMACLVSYVMAYSFWALFLTACHISYEHVLFLMAYPVPYFFCDALFLTTCLISYGVRYQRVGRVHTPTATTIKQNTKRHNP